VGEHALVELELDQRHRAARGNHHPVLSSNSTRRVYFEPQVESPGILLAVTPGVFRLLLLRVLFDRQRVGLDRVAIARMTMMPAATMMAFCSNR